jgi:serine protease AprX
MTKEQALRIIYPAPEGYKGRRFTQDTPILPDVWIAYAAGRNEDGSSRAIELLLTPHANSSVQRLVAELGERVKGNAFIAYNESHVLAELTFEQLLNAALPLSSWWQRNLETKDDKGSRIIDGIDAKLAQLRRSGDIEGLLLDPARHFAGAQMDSSVLDLIRIAGAILLNAPIPEGDERTDVLWQIIESLREFYATAGIPPARTDSGVPPLWSVSLNRTAETAVTTSRLAIKADAAIRLFDLSCRDIVWAIVDSGVDANHPAFTDWPSADPRLTNDCDLPWSRVIESYDFTLLMHLQRYAVRPEDPNIPPSARSRFEKLQESGVLSDTITKDLKERLRSGRPLEWEQLKPLIRVDRKSPESKPPVEHGTHVAGILAADWRKLTDSGPRPKHPSYKQPPDENVIGVCPDIRIYDLRVIGAGGGSEFAILAALQFVRYLNMNRDKMVIHGVNLSFSLQHNVKSYACGSTPICQECERLVNSGVVVVTAAGNRGYTNDVDNFESYRAMTITDPGNADSVITVGSTHRLEPHRYGVSYFSSRGPTGDGRMKPDLVAPGEKINSTIPGESAVELDGTSMAAPHVSGAAALLMARHQELIGRPQKVKEVLCRTATDLGRDRTFQGAGMLDILRAIQSV